MCAELTSCKDRCRLGTSPGRSERRLQMSQGSKDLSEDQNACMKKWSSWKGIVFMFWYPFPRRITHSTLLPWETTKPVSCHRLMSLSASLSLVHLGQVLARHIFVGFGIAWYRCSASLQKSISSDTPRLEWKREKQAHQQDISRQYHKQEIGVFVGTCPISASGAPCYKWRVCKWINVESQRVGHTHTCIIVYTCPFRRAHKQGAPNLHIACAHRALEQVYVFVFWYVLNCFNRFPWFLQQYLKIFHISTYCWGEPFR